MKYILIIILSLSVLLTGCKNPGLVEIIERQEVKNLTSSSVKKIEKATTTIESDENNTDTLDEDDYSSCSYHAIRGDDFDRYDRKYHVNKGCIYWEGRLIENMDHNSFEDLGYKYAKDKDSIFYWGHKKHDIDYSSFVVLNNYTYDKNNVYWHSSVIYDADALSFKILDENYGKDKNKVYYEKYEIEGIDDVSLFEVLDEYYSKDENNIYYKGKRMTDVDIDSFSYVKNDEGVWIKDKKHLFCYGKICESAGTKYKNNYYEFDRSVYLRGKLVTSDSDGFEVMGHGYSKNKKNVFYKDKLIEGIDHNNVKIYGYYIKDNNHVFGGGVMFQDIDAETFEVVGNDYRYIKDKNAFWHRLSHNVYVKFEDIDVEIVQVSREIIRDKNYVYCHNGLFTPVDLKLIEIADAQTFSFLSCSYAKDKKNVFYKCETLSGINNINIDTDSFYIYPDCQHSKDKNNVFFDSKVILGADSESFEILNHGYKKDKNNVYRWLEKIEGADPATFVTNSEFQMESKGHDAMDKNCFYREGEILKNK